MILIFTSYAVQDAGVQLHFVSPDPGAGMPSDWYVLVGDAELAGATNNAQLRQLVLDKLNRKLRAAGGIATRLDPFIGQSVVI
mgnify:FL=1